MGSAPECEEGGGAARRGGAAAATWNRAGRFTPEKQRGLDAFVANVGEAALERTLVVFTHCADAGALEAARAGGRAGADRRVGPASNRPPGRTGCATQASGSAPKALCGWLDRAAGSVCVENVAAPEDARMRLRAALGALATRVGADRYSNEALRDARRRQAADREEERAAFADAVADWRKGEGPVVVEREPAVAPRGVG